MSRNQFLALLLGFLLIAYGLFADLVTSADREDVGGPRLAHAAGDAAGADETARAEAGLAPEARRRGQAPPRPVVVEEGGESILLRVTFARDGAAAEGVDVELWRRAAGEGVARRSARRLTSGRVTDSRGEVLFEAPVGSPLKIFARTPPHGRVATIEVAALAAGESRVVEAIVERSPEPLDVRVVDDVTGEGIAGASIRAIPSHHEALEDFPGDSELLMRTDGDGRCTLGGQARRARWLLVDAAGFGPRAVAPLTLASESRWSVRLSLHADLEVVVRNADDRPVVGAEVRATYSIDGYVATSTSRTDDRGHASLVRLPAGVPIEPTVTPRGGTPRHFARVRLEPGETREYVASWID